MSIVVEWFDTNERIILLKMSSKWTLDELEIAVQQSREMTAQVSHTQLVHAIADLREGSMSVPRNIASNFRNIAETQLPNAGTTVIVTKSGFVHSLFNLIKRLSPGNTMYKIEKHYVIASTFEDAERRIQTLIDNEAFIQS
jgi:hypothetical protein